MMSGGEIQQKFFLQQKYNENAFQLFCLSLNMLFRCSQTINYSHMRVAKVELCALNG